MKKEMKKVLFLVLFVFAIFSFAKAEEITQENLSKDMKEVEIMHTPYGATVRLLQLEKNIIRNILHGEYILNAIKKNNITLNETTETRLNEIINELKNINEKIAEEIKNINKTNPEDAVSHFVEWKSEAINLTKEFKMIVSDIRKMNFVEIKEELKKIKNREIEKLEKEIDLAVKELNKERVQKILEITNLSKEDLMKQIKEGNLTATEMKKLINDKFRDINKTGKKAFLDKLKEEREKIELLKQEALNKRLKLEKENMEKVKQILSDDNLTISEKKAKLKVMAQEKIRERIKGVNNNEN